MSNDSAGGAGNNKPASTRWLIAVIAGVLAIDYATILRVEIFNEVKTGKTWLEAVMHGNIFLTAVGISISVIGVAWILYLLIGQKRDHSGD